MANRAQPLKNNLHKGVKCVWNEVCQKSIDQIKKYLAKSSYFNASYPKETTYCIHFSDRVFLGALLTLLDEHGKERAIYYISHTLISYEVNYTSIEKACLTVVFASQKL